MFQWIKKDLINLKKVKYEVTITLYKMNHVRLQIVQNECEQIFSVAQTADAKLVDDVL